MIAIWSIRALPYLLTLCTGTILLISGDPYWVQLVLGAALLAVLALSWDVLSRTGQVSLGQAAFFGIGAYTSALSGDFGWIGGWLMAAAVCGVTALLLGLLTLRLRQVYFTIATLALSLSFKVLILVFGDFTGGASGIAPPIIGDGDPVVQMGAVLVLVMLSIVASDTFLSDRYRPAFFMIRTKPSLAAVSGIPIIRMKILAFVVSGVLAGLAGAAYAGLYGYIVPDDVFALSWSVMPLAATILGGMDSTIGPFFGAIALKVLEGVARNYIGGVGYQIVYGAVMIVFIAVLPKGLAGLLTSVREATSQRRRATTAASIEQVP
jgi:branched-chain amino acid transport system permease protein